MPVADPVKLLEQHISKTNTSQAELARKLKTNHTMLGRVLSRERRIGVQLAKRIEDVAGIPARLWGDWFDQIDAQQKKSA